jgi:hypothetical protein
MNRRDFLYRAGMTTAGLALRGQARLPAQGEAARWRVFEITTRVRVMQPRGATRVWLPTPLAVAPYQKTMGDTYHPGEGTAVMIETNANEPDILGCSWDEGVEPVLTLVSRVATKDHHVDLGANAGTDVDRARAAYDWVAGQTFPDHGTHEDANASFVGRCRDAGVPARTVYGLGLSSADATKAQQCRAEVYLTGHGWVPVDPADARKVFGSWEMNWIAYNFAHDVALRGSNRRPLGYFMYPQGETAEGPIDSLDPEHFKYSITVEEVTSA